MNDVPIKKNPAELLGLPLDIITHVLLHKAVDIIQNKWFEPQWMKSPLVLQIALPAGPLKNT